MLKIFLANLSKTVMDVVHLSTVAMLLDEDDDISACARKNSIDSISFLSL